MIGCKWGRYAFRTGLNMGVEDIVEMLFVRHDVER